jgi:hypothetical protein
MLLEVLILGGLMGLLGQGARAVVGLKGMADSAKALDLSPNDLFEAVRLVVSLLIGFLVGLAAALIYIKTANSPLTEPTWQVLLGFAASGYAGVDFLEGFISQYLPQGGSASAVQKLAAFKAVNLQIQKAPPAYSYAQAESIVLKAFNALGKPNVKDTDTLTSLNLKTTTDLLGLLDAVNAQIPDDVHLLPIGTISSWKKTVGDVVTSVENAPTNPPPKN